jgi:DNA polymerase III delta subunit
VIRSLRPGRERTGLELLEGASRGEFPTSLYLEGPCEALKTALLGGLRHAWASRNPVSPLARVLRPAEDGVERVLDAYQGQSLFGAGDLIVVLEIEDLGRSEKRVAALAEGMSRGSGESCLVLVESAAESPRKSLDPLRAASEARWTALFPGRRELLEWGTSRLAREGISPEPGALEALADACEGDALAFLGELEKLCAWVGGGGHLRREEVLALLRPAVGAELPDFLATVAAGDSPLAAQRLVRLLASGVSEGSVVFALSNLVGGALGGWSRHREASETLRRRLPPRSLARALDALYRAESAWKGGKADSVAVLEQATREIAASGSGHSGMA